MSWEDVSVSPRKLRRDLNESEKLEIIKSDEIPPNDYSAEAVAKSLLHVSSQNRVFTMSFIYSVSVPIYRIFSCLLYTSPSPRDKRQSRMPSSA